jgi:hypothetical protein
MPHSAPYLPPVSGSCQCASLPHRAMPQVSGERDFFAQMCVDAVSCLDPATLDLRMIGIKKVGSRNKNECTFIYSIRLQHCIGCPGIDVGSAASMA